MRKLLTIFLAFSLLFTVFTVNTFAEDDEQNAPDSQAGVSDEQEVSEPQSEILPGFAVTQEEENGNIVLTFASKEHADAVDVVYFGEVSNSKAGPDGVFSNSLIYNDNKITVQFGIITSILQLKKGSTYEVYVGLNEHGTVDGKPIFDNMPKEITLTKGVEPWSISATVDSEGSLVISSENNFVNNSIVSVLLYTQESQEGYDTFVLLNHDEIEHTDDYTFISADYLKTYKFLKNTDYDITVTYYGVDGDQSASNRIAVNPVQFNFDQMTGPELIGRVDDGILYVETKDSDPSGYEFLRTYYYSLQDYSKEAYFEIYKDGIINRIDAEKYKFDYYNNGLQFNFLNDNFFKDIDINDNHKLYIRVPGRGLSEITFSVDENSMEPDSAAITQNGNGDIIISSEYNLNFEDVDSIYLYSSDYRYYGHIFMDQFGVADNEIRIPYSSIESSSLKGGVAYTVKLFYNSEPLRVVDESYILIKGSKKKDIPEFTVNQDENGDIVFNIDDEFLLEKLSEITFSNVNEPKGATLTDKYFEKDFVNKTLTIPCEKVRNSQLTSGVYEIEFWFEGFYFYYFNVNTYQQLSVETGSKLPVLPDFEMHQKDNGDIVITSESRDLIKHINRIDYYWTGTRAGGTVFFEQSMVKYDNELVIPYQVVKYSDLESGNTYVFGIELDDDGIFLNNDKDRKEREVYITSGSIIRGSDFISVDMKNGIICLTFEDKGFLSKIENGEYSIVFHVIAGTDKDTAVDSKSLIFDYSKNKVYLTTKPEEDGNYMLNIMDGDTCLAYGNVSFSDMPQTDIEKASEQLDFDMMSANTVSYLNDIYPDTLITLYNLTVNSSHDILETEANKYFKVYGLSPDNAFVVDISVYAYFETNGLWKHEPVPYDYPGENVELVLALSVEQMAKMGITADNWSTKTVTVLREHNGEVDELDATVEPVTVNGTIISFKVTFKTDKMSLFALANKNSIVRPSSGGSGSGSSSIVTTPVKKPVVNTSAK